MGNHASIWAGKRFLLFVLLGFVSIAKPVRSAEWLPPERFAFGGNPILMQAGSTRIEGGFTFVDGTDNWTAPEFLARQGLSERVELQVGYNRENYRTQDGFRREGVLRLDDVSSALKLRFVSNDRLLLAGVPSFRTTHYQHSTFLSTVTREFRAYSGEFRVLGNAQKTSTGSFLFGAGLGFVQSRSRTDFDFSVEFGIVQQRTNWRAVGGARILQGISGAGGSLTTIHLGFARPLLGSMVADVHVEELYGGSDFVTAWGIGLGYERK